MKARCLWVDLLSPERKRPRSRTGLMGARTRKPVERQLAVFRCPRLNATRCFCLTPRPAGEVFLRDGFLCGKTRLTAEAAKRRIKTSTRITDHTYQCDSL